MQSLSFILQDANNWHSKHSFQNKNKICYSIGTSKFSLIFSQKYLECFLDAFGQFRGDGNICNIDNINYLEVKVISRNVDAT